MALATVDIVRLTGAGPTATPITSGSTRWSSSDDPNPGTGNSVPIPTSGVNRSFWVATRLSVAANPDGHTINNLRWFPTTSNAPAGLTYEVVEASAYDQASGTVGTTGDALSTHASIVEGPVDVFTKSAASPLGVAGTTTTTGQFGNYVSYQAVVDQTAAPGLQPTETFTWRYDEG